MKKIIKKVIGIIARFYHRIRASRFVWTLLNLSSIRLYKKSENKLSDEQKKIVEDLNRDGIAISHIDKLFPKHVYAELEKIAQNRWNDKDVKERYDSRGNLLEGDKLKSKNFFLIDLWNGERILDLKHPLTKMSLSNQILGTVNAYMKMYMKFFDWRFQVTVPMPEGMRSYASQEWHRDPEDQQLVKVFLYLNDVDENAGPFIYVKKSHIFGKWRHISPQQPPRGSASQDSLIPNEDKIVCTGKAGTIIFCDTSGLHRGGHAKTSNRFMYTSVYTSPASVWPILYKYPKSLDTNGLTNEAKFAVSNKIKKEPKFYNF